MNASDISNAISAINQAKTHIELNMKHDVPGKWEVVRELANAAWVLDYELRSVSLEVQADA